jgi:hypothetical protein
MKMLCEFSGQPVWWQKKRYCSDMPNVVSAINGTSHWTVDREKKKKNSRQAANSQSMGFAINISHAQ